MCRADGGGVAHPLATAVSRTIHVKITESPTAAMKTIGNSQCHPTIQITHWILTPRPQSSVAKSLCGRQLQSRTGVRDRYLNSSTGRAGVKIVCLFLTRLRRKTSANSGSFGASLVGGAD